jgi:interleukin-1 receptor-associated kinase 4
VRKAGDKDRSCTEIFFDEWGTSGRKRPTVRLLYDYLKKLDFIRAADYIGTTYLNSEKTVFENVYLPREF